MGRHIVDTQRKPGIMWIELEGSFSIEEMREFVAAHNAGVDSFGQADYKVFVDIRKLVPLREECTELMEKAKAYSSAHKNFRGSAVLVSSAVVSMQHRRTSGSGGVLNSEMLSDDEAALWKHLERVYRN